MRRVHHHLPHRVQLLLLQEQLLLLVEQQLLLFGRELLVGVLQGVVLAERVHRLERAIVLRSAMPVGWQSLRLRLRELLLLHQTIRREGRASELRLRLRLRWLLEVGAIARRATDWLVLRGGSRVWGSGAGALETEARGVLPLQDPLAR